MCLGLCEKCDNSKFRSLQLRTTITKGEKQRNTLQNWNFEIFYTKPIKAGTCLELCEKCVKENLCGE